MQGEILRGQGAYTHISLDHKLERWYIEPANTEQRRIKRCQKKRNQFTLKRKKAYYGDFCRIAGKTLKIPSIRGQFRKVFPRNKKHFLCNTPKPMLARAFKSPLKGKICCGFVALCSEYAMRAFELYASGYLLKSITENQVHTALENLRHPLTNKEKYSFGESMPAMFAKGLAAAPISEQLFQPDR